MNHKRTMMTRSSFNKWNMLYSCKSITNPITTTTNARNKQILHMTQIHHKPNNNHNKRKKQTNTSHDSHPSMANTVSTHSNNKAKRCLRTVDPPLLQTEVNNKAARQLHVTDNDNDKTGNGNDDIPFKRRKRKRKRGE
eukprot:338446_1